jgi:ABC-type transport system involved in multi-copper enzyme maturation permease subunit
MMVRNMASIAANTFREAVRDRVLYSLIFFALLMVGTAPLFGEISIGLERIILINLGLTAIALFGVVIGVFIGTGLVSKEIEKRTLYTILSRPVQRWQFLLGKYAGLAMTLTVNAGFMAMGFFIALLLVTKHFQQGDIASLAALYFILLQFLMVTAVALLFSTFSSPLFAAIFSFALFVIGNFADDLRGFAAMAPGAAGFVAKALSYAVPNFGALNVITGAAHGQSPTADVIAMSTLYALVYSAMMIGGATLIFDRRNLK